MRPSLLWVAAATVVATVAVSWLPEEQPLSTPVHARSQQSPVPPAKGQPPGGPPGASSVPLVPPSSAPLDRQPWSQIQAADQTAWAPPAPPVRPSPAVAAPAAPPPPAPPPSPPPPPPAFAYQWLGQLVEDGRTRLFLAGAQRMEVHAVGDVMPEGWRIDGVQDGQLQLTWMATGVTVSVAARP